MSGNAVLSSLLLQRPARAGDNSVYTLYAQYIHIYAQCQFEICCGLLQDSEDSGLHS